LAKAVTAYSTPAATTTGVVPAASGNVTTSSAPAPPLLTAKLSDIELAIGNKIAEMFGTPAATTTVNPIGTPIAKPAPGPGNNPFGKALYTPDQCGDTFGTKAKLQGSSPFGNPQDTPDKVVDTFGIQNAMQGSSPFGALRNTANPANIIPQGTLAAPLTIILTNTRFSVAPSQALSPAPFAPAPSTPAPSTSASQAVGNKPAVPTREQPVDVFIMRPPTGLTLPRTSSPLKQTQLREKTPSLPAKVINGDNDPDDGDDDDDDDDGDGDDGDDEKEDKDDDETETDEELPKPKPKVNRSPPSESQAPKGGSGLTEASRHESKKYSSSFNIFSTPTKGAKPSPRSPPKTRSPPKEAGKAPKPSPQEGTKFIKSTLLRNQKIPDNFTPVVEKAKEKGKAKEAQIFQAFLDQKRAKHVAEATAQPNDCPQGGQTPSLTPLPSVAVTPARASVAWESELEGLVKDGLISSDLIANISRGDGWFDGWEFYNRQQDHARTTPLTAKELEVREYQRINALHKDSVAKGDVLWLRNRKKIVYENFLATQSYKYDEWKAAQRTKKAQKVRISPPSITFINY
jgi:hypothetical protein